jgi:hypothetical protein
MAQPAKKQRQEPAAQQAQQPPPKRGEPDDGPPPVQLMTIKELGSKLPIGKLTENGRGLKKEFALRPYKGRIDRHISHWRMQHDGEHIARLVSKFVSLLAESVGGEAVEVGPDGDSTAQQELKVQGWYYADVMYMYLYSRIVNISEWIEVPYVCRRCGETGIAKADLWTTEVRVINSVKQLEQWVELRSGIPLRNGETARKLKIRPVKFSSQLMPEAAAGALAMGYGEFREAVCGVDCLSGHYTLTDDELDEMPKIDSLTIDRQAGRVAAGPDLRTTIKCMKGSCGAPIREAFDWTFDAFFDSSVPLSVLAP